jgi:hypothetical protein
MSPMFVEMRRLIGIVRSSRRAVRDASDGPRFDKRRPIAVMHIPKTSGTSLNTALRKAIRPRNAVTGIDASAFGAFTAFHTFDPNRQSIVHREALPPGDFVAGHFSFATLTAHAADAQLVTVLREPRSRVVSNWLFWRSRPESDLRTWGEWRDAICQARAPLGTFLAIRAIACAIDNVTVRMLLWPDSRIPADAFINPRHDAALIEAALERLNQFAFVDVVENPSLRTNLQNWLGRRVKYPRMNETSFMPESLRSPLSHELTREAADLLEQRSRLDRVLWTSFAERLIGPTLAQALCERTFGENSTRYAALMAR